MSCPLAIACDHRVARVLDVDVFLPMHVDALIVGVEYHY